MTVIGLDPGLAVAAYAVLRDGRPVEVGLWTHGPATRSTDLRIAAYVRDLAALLDRHRADLVAIEDQYVDTHTQGRAGRALTIDEGLLLRSGSPPRSLAGRPMVRQQPPPTGGTMSEFNLTLDGMDQVFRNRAVDAQQRGDPYEETWNLEFADLLVATQARLRELDAFELSPSEVTVELHLALQENADLLARAIRAEAERDQAREELRQAVALGRFIKCPVKQAWAYKLYESEVPCTGPPYCSACKQVVDKDGQHPAREEAPK